MFNDEIKNLKKFYKNKKVLLTGHTGFKGYWLSLFLKILGAKIYGISLLPNKKDNLLYKITNLKNIFTLELFCDISNYKKVDFFVKKIKPDVVFHLAAQALVLESYKNPFETYKTNVLGTVSILNSIRELSGIKSFVNITTDKVYLNDNRDYGYSEEDTLMGIDPYSNSKSCSELVTYSYIKSFLQNIPVSTCRSGNVIGGGDFSENRIIPDCYRSIKNKSVLVIRNKNSIRPYQHVLDPIFLYSIIGMKQVHNKDLASSYNIGPDIKDCLTTFDLAQSFYKFFNKDFKFKEKNVFKEKESNILKLDNSKIKKIFNWIPLLSIEKAVFYTSKWYQTFLLKKENIFQYSKSQIKEIIGL